MDKQSVLVIGEVFVDTHLDIVRDGEPLTRLGGVFHSARAFSALDIDFSLAYYSPDYLEDDINRWSSCLGAKVCYRLGRIYRAPTVMLISESTESGFQGYINILRKQTSYTDTGSLEDIMEQLHPSDVLLFPGRYDVLKMFDILSRCDANLHIDIGYDSNEIMGSMEKLKPETVFLSTSSEAFLKKCGGTYSGLLNQLSSLNAEKLLLKENRGGSICFDLLHKTSYEAPTYRVPTMHSVGVGDVYDAAFISFAKEDSIEKRMRFAALCAARYAETMDFASFRSGTEVVQQNFGELSMLLGERLSWEKRKEISIYLAAPDFPSIDTSWLDALYASLEYHNFSPRRPIKENGLVDTDTDEALEFEIFNKDLQLLDECSLLIAVLLNNDPGTLVELGMFKKAQKPTIIFDPYHYCTNMFVRHTPDELCHSLSEVISAVFSIMGRKL